MRITKLDPEALAEPPSGGDPARPSTVTPSTPTMPPTALARALVEYEWALRSLLSDEAGRPEPVDVEKRRRQEAETVRPLRTRVQDLPSGIRLTGTSLAHADDDDEHGDPEDLVEPSLEGTG